MTINSQTGVADLPRRQQRKERRRAGRMETESVACNLGSVLNLSAKGMRVLCWKTPKTPITIELAGCGAQLQVQGEVAWTQRVGLFRRIVGIHFIGLTPEQTRQLTSMAMVNTVRRTIG